MAHAGKATGKGGLALLFEMVLGGLVGTSPHMISASVMALARLLHQFANELGGEPQRLFHGSHMRTRQACIPRSTHEVTAGMLRSVPAAGVAPALLPAVLSLLRTKSREVVKSVLGFVKVRCCPPLFILWLSCRGAHMPARGLG